jgi:hypothetical protein
MVEVRQQLLITLIHGTWGRGFFPRNQQAPVKQDHKRGLRTQTLRPLWFEEGSPFRTRLDTELSDISHESKPLYWSGKNAIFERDKAARVLAEYISTEHLEHPGSTQLIIAHSHAGNIALRALQHLQKPDALKMDDAERAKPLVVTLATPFIEIHKAELGSRPNLVRLTLVLLLTLLATASFFAIGGRIDDLIGFNAAPIKLSVEQFLAESAVRQWRSSVVTIISICSGGLVGLVTGWWLLFRQAPVRRDRIQSLTEATRLGEIPSAQSRRLLIIRAINDEASLAMALGTILNFAATRAIIFTLVTFVLLTNGFYFLKSGFPWIGAAVSLGMLLAVIAAFMAGLATLFGMLVASRVVHGRELAISPMECQINTQSAPDVVELSKIVTLVSSTVAKSLRHGIYDHEECAKTISDWVRMQLYTAR